MIRCLTKAQFFFFVCFFKKMTDRLNSVLNLYFSADMKKILFIILFLMAPTFPLKVTIDPLVVKGPFTKFWKSTGFSPPVFDQTFTRKFLLSKDVEHNLAIISALPNQGIEFIRIHWLLNLLEFNSNGTINWEDLDKIIDWIVENDMKPIIELMVNPDTDQKKKIFKNDGRYFWKWFTSTIAQHYVDKYGSKLVSEWRFETWNEPDLKMYNVLHFGLEDYIDYVRGCGEGIKTVLPEVDFGGPAGLFMNKTSHPLCWGFLNYCNNDLKRCNLDYVSLHKKGNGSSSEILNGMNLFHEQMKEKFPNLSMIPLINDEADILSGWWRDEDWRGDVRYAAAVCRTILQYRSVFQSLDVRSISNDNGFLNTPPNFFNQRTLLTRFIDAENNAHFVQKPVYAAMGLLSKLGEDEVQTFIKADDRISILATRTNNYDIGNKTSQLNVMIVYSSDTMELNDTERELEIVMLSPDWENARYALYKLENRLPNPKEIWKDSGSPIVPSLIQLSIIRQHQEPKKIAFGKVKKFPFSIKSNVVQPSISFLQICDISMGIPVKIIKLKAYNISVTELLLTWKQPVYHYSCIKTYYIEYCSELSPKGRFLRINKNFIIFNSFHVNSSMMKNGTVLGFYRVAAVDFWNRKGRYSNVLHFTT